MNAELKEFLQSILEMSFEEKVELGRSALAEFSHALADYGLSDNEIGASIVGFTRLFVSADYDCGREEYEFFKAVTGQYISESDFYDLTNHGRDNDFLQSAGEYLDSMTFEQRRAIVIYGVALLSCDNVLKVDEIKMIEVILGQ